MAAITSCLLLLLLLRLAVWLVIPPMSSLTLLACKYDMHTSSSAMFTNSYEVLSPVIRVHFGNMQVQYNGHVATVIVMGATSEWSHGADGRNAM